MSRIERSRNFLFALLLGVSVVSYAAPNDTSAVAPCSEDTGGIGGTGVNKAPGGIGGTGQTAEGGISGTGQRAEGGIGGTGVSPADQSVRPVAGRILFTHGNVHAETTGQSRALSKGDWVCEGDSVVSVKGAFAQISMKDGGTLIVRADTKLVIEKFSFKGVIDGTEKLVLFLEKGGFRAITGSIGKQHKENYSIRTATAVISIRGTDHEVYFVPPPTAKQKSDSEPGTYNRVISGGTSMRTERGMVFVNPMQIGFAPFRGVPRLLQSTPPFFKDITQKLGGGAHQILDAKGNLDHEAIIEPVTILNGVVDLDTNVAQFINSPVGTASVGTNLSSGSVTVGGLVTDNSGLTVLVGGTGLPLVISDSVTNYSYVSDSAQLLSLGSAFVDSVNVKWGIYAGGVTFDSTGNATPVDFHHFALAAGGATPNQVVKSVTGTANFSNVVGFTMPINEQGGIGGNVTINTRIQLGASPAVTSYNIGVTDANSRTWAGTFSGSVPLSAFAQTGVPLAVNCTGPQCGSGAGTGSATGILIGPNAKGLLTSYGLTTSTGQAVGGTAVLSRP